MITNKEYELLKHYRATGYGWIARDWNYDLYAFKTIPTKFVSFWSVQSGFSLPCLVAECGDNILTCVSWEDEEPTKILDLIQDYESHQVIVGEKVKVIVPHFVADWIEEVKGLKRNFKLEYLFDTTEMPDDVFEWLDERYGDTDILAKAWLDGFVVEKEKLYTVTLSNGYTLGKGNNLIVFLNDEHTFWLTYETKLTQSEIESVDPILMKIAKEVE